MFDFCVLTLSLQLCCNHLVLVVLRVFVYSFEFPTLMIMLSVNRDVVCTFFFLFFLSHSLQKLVLSVQCWEVMVRWDISSFGLLSGKVSFFLIINYDISYSFFFFFKQPLSEEVLPIPSILRVLSCKGNGLCQMLFLHLLVNHVIFVFSLLM